MRIYLIGFMGAGKSFFGKKLAKLLDYDFIDLDKMIESEENITIPEIFAKRGEPHFRYLEHKYLTRTSSHDNTIIATGGGTVCYNKNMDFINSHGCSIYLEASPNLLARRLHNEREWRPLLHHLDDKQLLAFIENLLHQRSQYYERAHFVIHQSEETDIDVQKIATVFKRLIF